MISAQKTIDGSLTLFSDVFQETYHSRHGAITESLHIFIENGLRIKLSENQILKVGEIGLGTGLNAMLSLRFAEENKQKIDYFSIEAYPIPEECKSQICDSYSYLGLENFEKLLEQKPNLEIDISPTFRFQWFHLKWPEQNPFSELDVLFYDAFAPDSQPELWDELAMKQAYSALKLGGILVTYCAKAYVKRNMKAVGFEVERLKGPPGKLEMTRATKNVNDLNPTSFSQEENS